MVHDNLFYGVMFWEIDSALFMNQTVIPLMFQEKKYAFAQVIVPETPLSNKVGLSLYEYHYEF